MNIRRTCIGSSEAGYCCCVRASTALNRPKCWMILKIEEGRDNHLRTKVHEPTVPADRAVYRTIVRVPFPFGRGINRERAVHTFRELG